MNLWRASCLVALCLAAALPVHASAGDGKSSKLEYDVVELIPQDPPTWSLTNLFAPITGLFLGGPGYWYSKRVVEIDTTPPGAILDLFYVRRNFQKRYEQADAPARVILPSRIEATSRDTLTVRALLDGHRQQEIQIPIRSRTDRVMIDLAPLPNSLVVFAHTYFAGRGSLVFLTKEALTFRLQKSPEGFGVVLTETADTPEAAEMMRGVESSLIRRVQPQQLGEDLVVRVDLTDLARSDAFETRSRQWDDPVRGLHGFALDLVSRGGDDAAIERARAALARITPGDVSGCALEFDASLRDALDPAALARALTPSGAHTDAYLRAAMKRLGEVSPDGVIRMRDGSRFRGAIPIELMAAATEPHEAIGYLSLLRRFVAELEPESSRRSTLRGLVAPEVAPKRFDQLVDDAEARERGCRGSGGLAASSPH
jgi:hypothetical protein